jgi:hypothetical protein
MRLDYIHTGLKEDRPENGAYVITPKNVLVNLFLAI